MSDSEGECLEEDDEEVASMSAHLVEVMKTKGWFPLCFFLSNSLFTKHSSIFLVCFLQLHVLVGKSQVASLPIHFEIGYVSYALMHGKL
jgi:hypothetical protein